MAKLTVKAMRDQIAKCAGNISAIARSFGRSRSAVYSFIHDHPELKEALCDAREAMSDNVVSRFYADCLKDDPAYQKSRIFYLSTVAKDRGFVQRQEHTGKDGESLNTSVIVYLPSNGRDETTDDESDD